MNTLVVNYAFEPIQIVGWQKAVYLLVTEKAEPLVETEVLIRSVSLSVKLPRIVRLKRYTKIKRRKRNVFRKLEVFTRDNWQCQYCGEGLTRRTATIDHVLPRSKGGKTSWKNTVTACAPCNSKKADKSPREARMNLRSDPEKPEFSDVIGGELADLFENYMKGNFYEH